jgi:hypothetical protein
MRKRGPTDSWSQLQESDLYSPVHKATEARLLLALAAAEGAKVIKTYTKQAYLHGDMGDKVVYIRPPDWWPEPIPEAWQKGTFFSYRRAFMARGRLLVNGILIYQLGWRIMDMRQ